MFALDLLSDPILQGEIFRLAVEEIGLARFSVARCCDQEELLVFGRVRKANILSRQLGFQQFIVGFEGLVLPVHSPALVNVGRSDQAIGQILKRSHHRNPRD